MISPRCRVTEADILKLALHVGGTGHVPGTEDGCATRAADRGSDPFASRLLDVVDDDTGDPALLATIPLDPER